MSSYCSLVPRSSNNSQAHLKFCFAKGACSLLNHVLTQPDSKCLAAVWTVIPVPQTLKILLTNFYNGCIVKTQHVAAYEITRKEVTSMFKSIILHNRTALTILTVKTRTNRILPSDFCTHSWSRTLKLIPSSYFSNLTTHGQLWNIITALFL